MIELDLMKAINNLFEMNFKVIELQLSSNYIWSLAKLIIKSKLNFEN